MAEHSLLSHGRVSAEELRGLLRQEEGLRLEFKKKYDLTGQEKGKRLDELAKDLLALLNTAGRHADDYAYLILGAGDELHDHWTRDYEPVPPGQYTQKQFLGVVNGRCIPDVLSIEYQEIELDGRQYGVVILPPSPHVHALARDLQTPKRVWPKHGVVMRSGEGTILASEDHIRVMREQKSSWIGSHRATDLDGVTASLDQSTAGLRSFVTWFEQLVLSGVRTVDIIKERRERSRLRQLLQRLFHLSWQQRRLPKVLRAYVTGEPPGTWEGVCELIAGLTSTVDGLIELVSGEDGHFVVQAHREYASLLFGLKARAETYRTLMTLEDPRSENSLRLITRIADDYQSLIDSLQASQNGVARFLNGRRSAPETFFADTCDSVEYDLFGVNSVHLSKLSDGDMARLEGLYEINDLYIYDSSVSDNGLKHLADLKELERLSLVVTQITDAGLVHLQGLPLSELCLNRNQRITGRALGHLAPIRTLKKLRIGLCPMVGDEGMSDIQELLQLQELELNQTAISDVSVPYLMTLQKLRNLNVGETRITKEGAARLREALPDLVRY